VNRAKWSDAFFNYVPAEPAYAEWCENPLYTDRDRQRLLGKMAEQFREANPACPLTAEELTIDFTKRV